MPTFTKVLGCHIAATAAAPATQNQAGYEALTWTAEINDCVITNFDGFSGSWSLVEDDTICAESPTPSKGKYSYGEFPFTAKYDEADDAFWDIIHAGKLDPNNPVSIRILHPDGTKAVYFQGLVMADNPKYGGQDDNYRHDVVLQQIVEQVKVFA